MNEDKGILKDNDHNGKKSEMSRRQFLTYTLGATGGFLAAGITIPMIRFAVDPLLSSLGDSSDQKVVEVAKVGADPIEVKFMVNQKDGWYESENELIAWIYKEDGGDIRALSPVCKHLGCTVNYSKNDNQFICPCHDARYEKTGKNVTVAPTPLDEYTVSIKEGFVYLGGIVPNHLSGN